MTVRYLRTPVALVVNSHHALRRALCERIKTTFANFRLLEAASVEDALMILDEEEVDIVLIDGERNGMNGLKGTRTVLERSPSSSVVVMSAFDEPTCRDAASRAGAMAFVSKRAIGSELMDVLAELMGEREARTTRGGIGKE